jgi:hypothetical protein
VRREVLSVAAGAVLLLAAGSPPADDPRLKGAYRFEEGGWIYVHLEGSPARVGFQHGALLAPEIADALAAVRLDATHRTKRDWAFFRDAARDVLWPGIDAEYREELLGILEGARARGVALDIHDLVALNAFEELPDYYVPWLNARQKATPAPRLVSPGNCSAFVATGSYTRDGRIVIAHNNWTSYWAGARWNVVFDLVPDRGQRMFMDGFPGVITSDDDFGVNAAGLMVTETTITQFKGYDPKGKPEFVRSRKALQYAASIDDYVRLMRDGNNGGYANDWLIGDRKTGEIAQLELGLKTHRLWRSKDGYFVGSNFARDPVLIKEETDFKPGDAASSPNARRARWEQLMKASRGKIDAALAEAFLGDDQDVVLARREPDERALCGRVDLSPRGVKEWEWGPFYPGGAVQGKTMDDSMAAALSFRARMGPLCGPDFLARPFLVARPEYAWQNSILRDMKTGPWTTFRAGQRAPN